MSVKGLSVSALLIQATQFHSNYAANKIEFPSVTPDEDASLGSAMTALSVASANKNAAETARKTATQVMTSLRIDLATQLAKLSNKIKAEGTATEFQLAVGLTPNKVIRSTVVPLTISDLVAEANSNGINRLSWRPNGNRYGVSYDIEGRFGDEGDFMPIGSTQNRGFKHSGQIPGNYGEYRIITRAAKSVSDPSASVTVYAQNRMVPQN
jgi:hypothetical protein